MAAIYMWYAENEVVYTTTPFPVDIQDGVAFNMSLGGAAMRPIPQDEVNLSWGLLQAPIVQILMTTGPYDEATDLSWKLQQAPLVQILLTTGPYDEATDLTWELLQAPLISKLVTAYTPEDEGLEFSISLKTSDCVMTHV